MKELGDIVETLAENDKAMEEMAKPWEQKLKEEEERTTVAAFQNP